MEANEQILNFKKWGKFYYYYYYYYFWLLYNYLIMLPFSNLYLNKSITI